jgi:hypothetical protein
MEIITSTHQGRDSTCYYSVPSGMKFNNEHQVTYKGKSANTTKWN